MMNDFALLAYVPVVIFLLQTNIDMLLRLIRAQHVPSVCMSVCVCTYVCLFSDR